MRPTQGAAGRDVIDIVRDATGRLFHRHRRQVIRMPWGRSPILSFRSPSHGVLRPQPEEAPWRTARIDPTRGPHAAADLTDEDLEQLARIIAWEVAVRTTTEQFRDQLGGLADQRVDMQEAIDAVRKERELMRFAAEVMNDIQRLPEVPETPDVYGHYL